MKLPILDFGPMDLVRQVSELNGLTVHQVEALSRRTGMSLRQLQAAIDKYGLPSHKDILIQVAFPVQTQGTERPVCGIIHDALPLSYANPLIRALRVKWKTFPGFSGDPGYPVKGGHKAFFSEWTPEYKAHRAVFVEKTAVLLKGDFSNFFNPRVIL